MIVPGHIVSVLAVLLAQSPVTPRQCDHTVITTGGTAVSALTGPVTSGWLQNPKTAIDQSVEAAEPLFLDEVTTAGTAGNGTTLALQPGETYYLPNNSSATVSTNAGTSGHKFGCTRW